MRRKDVHVKECLTSSVVHVCLEPTTANTKHLYDICTMLDQRRRRWAGVVQMLYRCFVFAGTIYIYTSLALSAVLILVIFHTYSHVCQS